MTDNQFSAEHAAGNNDVSGKCPRWATGVCWKGATGACRKGAPKACRQGPGKVSCIRRRSSRKRPGTMRLHRNAATRLLTAFVGFALLLGGCRTDSTFEFKADGSVKTEIIVEDETGSMRELKGNCDELRTVASATRKFLAEGKTEDITPPNGNLTCRITSKVMPDNVKFEERSNSYTITLPASNVRKPDLDTVTARTTIIMPGKIIKANVGSVSGNKVKINGIDYIADGFTITSRKGSSASPATDTPTTTAASSGRRFARNDSSLWVWTGVGCTALATLTLGGLATLRTARKRKQHVASRNSGGVWGCS